MPFSFFKRKKKKESSKSQYLDLTISQVITETEDAVTIVFEEPEAGNLQYKPGQFLTLIENINGSEVRRAYSLCSSPYVNERPAVTVKRVENGLMSNYVNDNFKIGDSVRIMEPMGTFTIDVNPKKHVYLIGGGSGITPLLSIAKSTLSVNEQSKVSLIYANRDINSIIFKENIKSLKESYGDRFNIIQYLEKSPDNWTEETGYLTIEKLTKNIQTLSDENFSDIEYMTCGPEPLMNIVISTLEQLGIPAEKQHKESFTASNSSDSKTVDEGGKPIDVIVIHEGEQHAYTVDSGKTILEAGLDQGLDLPYSCQSGLCTACRGTCKSGEVIEDSVSVLSSEEKEQGYVLMCISKPKSDNVVIEVG
ncbi:ferredoxin--NADP reductase [Reichenbachiella versicolor]|uniref:ferredoxin--NADP reductase n=1 Tax=Reichenbachiella versicolor TaxID=1821036 RepID=UPI000D6E6E22|nr:ferredoxin--NADP reductase [Reichenbachiella versicolor]